MGKEYFTKELNELNFRKDIFETIHNILFSSLNFDEFNLGTKADKAITDKFFSDYFNASTRQKPKIEKDYYDYVTKRFFENNPHLCGHKLISNIFFGFVNMVIHYIKYRDDKTIKDLEIENNSLNHILGITQNKLIERQSKSKLLITEETKTKRGDVLSKLTPEFSRVIINLATSEICQKKNGTINFRELGRELGIDHKTAKRWLYYSQKQLH